MLGGVAPSAVVVMPVRVHLAVDGVLAVTVQPVRTCNRAAFPHATRNE